VVRSNVEVIRHDALGRSGVHRITFEKGSRLREIGDGAFSRSGALTAFIVSSSVEIIEERKVQLAQSVSKSE
jgi:hypothetical protein